MKGDARLPDRPGALAQLSALLAEEGANIFEVVHHRVGAAHSLNRVDLELTLEIGDHAQGERIIGVLRQAGYSVDAV